MPSLSVYVLNKILSIEFTINVDKMHVTEVLNLLLENSFISFPYISRKFSGISVHNILIK